MFDWNDEELTNIIWGEAGEGDDHIVPYQEGVKDNCSKEEWSQEVTTNKSLESKLPGATINFHGKKLESCSNFISNVRISASGSSMGLWSDLSLSNAAITDSDPMGRDLSDRIEKVSKNNSTSVAVKPELDKDPEFFQNAHEDKDQGDFDYSWDNIGSFDDLDQIFRPKEVERKNRPLAIRIEASRSVNPTHEENREWSLANKMSASKEGQVAARDRKEEEILLDNTT